MSSVFRAEKCGDLNENRLVKAVPDDFRLLSFFI